MKGLYFLLAEIDASRNVTFAVSLRMKLLFQRVIHLKRPGI